MDVHLHAFVKLDGEVNFTSRLLRLRKKVPPKPLKVGRAPEMVMTGQRKTNLSLSTRPDCLIRSFVVYPMELARLAILPVNRLFKYFSPLK